LNHKLIRIADGKRKKTRNAQILYSEKRLSGTASLNPSGIIVS
jgi:hypothetical protein